MHNSVQFCTHHDRIICLRIMFRAAYPSFQVCWLCSIFHDYAQSLNAMLGRTAPCNVIRTMVHAVDNPLDLSTRDVPSAGTERIDRIEKCHSGLCNSIVFSNKSTCTSCDHSSLSLTLLWRATPNRAPVAVL